MKLALPFLSNILPEKILQITSDSRQVAPGSVFFAIQGTQIDGHELLEEVFKKGALAAVVEKKVNSPFPGKTFSVPSTRKAFAIASSYYFDEPSRGLRMFGVTGTNGKTTTTFLWKKAFETLGLKTGVIGTVGIFNGDSFEEGSLTTPGAYDLHRYLAEMKSRGVQSCAMEVSSIALDQERAFGISYEVALFTNFTQDHLDYHGNMESYFSAKKKLFEEYVIQKAVIATDSPFGKEIWSDTTACEKISFGVASNADFCLEGVTYDAFKMHLKVRGPSGKHYELSTDLMGQFNALNLLGVLASFPEEKIEVLLQSFEMYQGAPGRLERVPLSDGPLVFVDYAHTPDALENVLCTLRSMKAPDAKLLTVFGCGGNRDRTKRPQMAAIASAFSDRVFITSDNPREEDPLAILKEIERGVAKETQYELEIDRRKAIHSALGFASSRDIVLIAGKGHENYQIIGKQKLSFDDREVVRDYYRNASSNHVSKS